VTGARVTHQDQGDHQNQLTDHPSMKNLLSSTLHEAAIGIQRGRDKTAMPDLHLMPYSRFSVEDSSLWWLCTIKARTAFDQGKPDRFGFESETVGGLHVEWGVNGGSNGKG